MTEGRLAPRLLLITDPAFADETLLRCVDAAAGALPPGAFGVQLRDKRRPLASLRMLALALRVVTRKHGAWLVVNGDAGLARDVGADGVHLGRGAGDVAAARAAFGRRTWVSVAAHSDDEARRAMDDGADAALVSPVFPTRPPSPAAPPKRARGLDALRFRAGRGRLSREPLRARRRHLGAGGGLRRGRGLRRRGAEGAARQSSPRQGRPCDP